MANKRHRVYYTLHTLVVRSSIRHVDKFVVAYGRCDDLLRPNATEVMNEGDYPVTDQGKKLDDEDYSVNGKKNETEGTNRQIVVNQSWKGERVEQDDPHEVDQQENGKYSVSKAL